MRSKKAPDAKKKPSTSVTIEEERVDEVRHKIDWGDGSVMVSKTIDGAFRIGTIPSDDGFMRLLRGEDFYIGKPTREAALAIAEAFTRLAEELPEAPTE